MAASLVCSWGIVAVLCISLAAAEEVYKIEGKVSIPGDRQQDWTSTTKVLVDGNKYIGYLQSDGAFVVNNIPAGSHLVQIVSPNYAFEPVRVDISRTKGKMRARKVNFLQPSKVIVLPYPLRLRAKHPIQYFETRESWKIADILYNPMVIMMVLPLILVFVLPKLLSTNDPEVQKELQNMNMLKQSKELPEMTSIFQWMFPEGKQGKSSRKSVAKKR